jgi:hypothetical protein
MKTYKTPNDYRAIILAAQTKGCLRTIEDKLIYGDNGTDSSEFDGIGHLLRTDIAGSESFAAGTGSQAYDMGGASSPVTIAVLRQLIDRVRPKPTCLLMTRTMRNTLSAVAFEKGLVLSNATGGGRIAMGVQDFGKRVDYFDGVPIIISDYQGGSFGETDNTVNKATSTSGICSIWALRFGAIEDGGISLVTGGDTGGGVNLFKMTELQDLEDFDAGGIRLVAYCALAQGSYMSSAVVHSIDENGVIVG